MFRNVLKKKESKETSQRFKVKKRYLSAVALIIVVLAGIKGYRFMTGENVGEVQPPEVAAALDAVQPKTQEPPLLTLSSQYIFIKYKDVYSDVRNLGPEINALERYQLRAHSATLGSKSMAITIKKLPTDGLDGESAYRLRLNQPAVYKQTTKTVGGEQIIFMQKADGSEVTFFAVHKNLLALVALTSGRSGDQLMDEAADLAARLEWRM